MSRSPAFDIAVLGGGPTGLMAALAAAKLARTALILDRRPNPHGPLRIDVIPARTLALLAECGIDPRAIGAETLFARQGICWETEAPRWSENARTAHIERPLLECALFDALCADNRVTVLFNRARPNFNGVFQGAGWRAKTLIDATGRAAITARQRIRLKPAWASRFFWASRRAATRAAPQFQIVALPNGYAYRLGSARHIGIGIVGRAECLNGAPAALLQHVRFLTDGMPDLVALQRGASGVTSVQWSIAGDAALAGDAAIARDPLSSQGLAASLSDALYAVAAIGSGNLNGVLLRQAENLSAHLRLLKQQIARCRYNTMPIWQAYDRFISEQMTRLPDSQTAPALRDGRIEEPVRGSYKGSSDRLRQAV